MSSGAVTPTYPLGTIAKLLMLSERRVNQLVAAGIIPRAERGRYELAPAVQGYIRFLQDRSLNASTGDVDFHAEKALLTKAQREMAELDLAKARGEVAPINEFERASAAMDTAIRTNVLNVPARVVLQLLGCTDETEFKTKLRAELVLALDTAANTNLDLTDEDEEEEQIADTEGATE